MIIPIGSVDRLMREVKIERVSKNAAESLTQILEEIGKEITKLAYQASKHANRTTIKQQDIIFAFKIWKK